MKKIAIIGSGITALARAWELQKFGHMVTVLERSDQVGGSICSCREGAYLAEEGPNSIQVNSSEVDAFLKSIPGFSEHALYASVDAKKRFILKDGLPRTVPMSLLSAVTTKLWSPTGKLALLKKLLIPTINPGTEESIADFSRRRLGNELYEYAINPMVGGIYAGDPESLSLRYAFPKIHALEKRRNILLVAALDVILAARKKNKPRFKKRILSFKNGLLELPQLLAKALGESVKTGVCLESIGRNQDKWVINWNDHEYSYDQVILTTPAHSLSKLPLEPSLHNALEFLGAIDYPPVSVLNVAFKRSQVSHPLDGFGLLVPECERRSILGVLFPSSIFQHRTPEGDVLLTIFVGGNRQPELATPDTEELLRLVLPEIGEILGIKDSPCFIHHKYWDKSIPQYNLGYGQFLKQIKDVEKKFSGLQIMGNYRDGISLSNCIEQAIRS